MLSDRRNCFLGRWPLLEGFLTWPSMGEALLRECECRLPKGCLSFGGPMSDAMGEWAELGLLSRGGEAVKHSSRDARLFDN